MRPALRAHPTIGPVEAWPVVALLISAAAVRCYHLGAPTLTGDEWFMLRNAVEGPGWIVAQARVFEPHPLLYYLGFWLWVALTGTTEWATRYPSVLLGVLTCAAVWRLGRQVGGPGVGLGAGVLAALNPYQVAQSQNARNYAMVAALATVATGLLVVATNRNGRSWWRYAVVMLLALNTHLNAALVFAAHVGWTAWGLASRRLAVDGRALRAFTLIAGLFALWLIYAAPALLAYRGFYPERIGPVEVGARTLATFSFGQQEMPRRLLVGFAALLVGLGGCLLVWRGLRTRCADAGPLVVAVAAVPVIGSAALFLVRPMFEERYLIVAAPAVLALAAASGLPLNRLRAPLAALPGIALALVAFPYLQRYYPSVEQSRPDWRGLASWVAEHERPGDVVLIASHGIADAYGYYGRAEAPVALRAPETATTGPIPESWRGAFHLPYPDSPADAAERDTLLRRGFAGEGRWFRNQRVQFFALPEPGDPAPAPIGARWLGAVELVEASVAPRESRAGEPIRVLLRWRALTSPPDLKISLRLIEASSGRQVTQLDRRPLDESRPFDAFSPGEVVRDGHVLVAPRDSAPGSYDVALLLYRPADARAERPDGASDDLVGIGRLQILP